MKPYEYYNYATPKRKAWWLPLVLVLALVAGGSIWRSCRAESDEPLPTGPSQSPVGLVEQNWHAVLIDGTLYNVLDADYQGDFDLQTLCFSPAAGQADPDADVQISVEGAEPFPADFPREAVLDRAAYEAFCAEWGLTPAFPAHEGRWAVIASALSGSAGPRVRVGGLRRSGQGVTALVWTQYERRAESSAGFVLVFPVPDGVTEIRTEQLRLPEELPAAP